MRGRLIAACVALTLVMAACGNSGDNKTSATTTPKATPAGETTAPSDLTKHVPVEAPGVTDTEIHVAAITDATNILGGHFKEFTDGIEAYFAMVNAGGGIYGRQLKVTSNRDSKMVANQSEVKASLAQDNPFAMFIATVLFTGAGDLAAAKIPTFTLSLNPEFAGKDNLFGTLGALCFDCLGQGAPWLATQNKVTSVGILAYGVSAESQRCGQGFKASFEKYAPGIKIGTFDVNLQYAQPDLSAQVSEMKDAGVQMVFTCMDQKETLILAKEMDKQGLKAVQSLPQGYDAQFIKDNARIFEGSFVAPQFVAFEKEPQNAETKLFLEWIKKTGKPTYEFTVSGWIAANQFVKGLQLAGPEFSQQKVIDGLNTLTDFSANGMIVPIDWTKQHNDPDGHPEFRSKYACANQLKVESGKLVPVYDQPGKPWVCMVGGPDAPKLTTVPEYRNFAEK